MTGFGVFIAVKTLVSLMRVIPYENSAELKQNLHFSLLSEECTLT